MLRSISLILSFTLLSAAALIKDPAQLQPNDEFLIKLSVGTPAQTFLLQADTSSSFTLIPQEKAENGNADLPSLKPKLSTTLKTTSTVTIDNLFGEVKASLATDVASWNDEKFTNFTFAVVDKFFPSYSDNRRGNLALGFSNPIDQNYLFINSLAQSNEALERAFKISYDDKESSWNVSIGNQDTSKEAQTVPVLQKSVDERYKQAWPVQLVAVKINDTVVGQYDDSTEFVSFDSGSSFITANKSYAASILDALDVACYLQEGETFDYILCPVDKEAPSISFKIGEQVFTIEGEDLKVTHSDTHNKIAVIFSDKIVNGWNLGLVFFKQFDITFDYEKAEVTLEGGEEVKDWWKQIGVDDETEKQQFLLIAAIASVSILLLLIICCYLCTGSKKQNLLDQEMAEN